MPSSRSRTRTTCSTSTRRSPPASRRRRRRWTRCWPPSSPSSKRGPSAERGAGPRPSRRSSTGSANVPQPRAGSPPALRVPGEPVGGEPDDRGDEDGPEAELALTRQLERAVDALPADEAERREGGCPQTGADGVDEREAAKRHPRRAGDERGEGTDDPDEPADEDRLAAVGGEVALRPRQPGRRHAERTPVTKSPAAADCTAERVPGDVAGEGGEPNDDDQRREVDVAAAGDQAAEDDRELARRNEPDERRRFEERQRADEHVGPRSER